MLSRIPQERLVPPCANTDAGILEELNPDLVRNAVNAGFAPAAVAAAAEAIGPTTAVAKNMVILKL